MKHLNRRLDRKIFRNTAERTRAVNLARVVSRGGIRF